MTETQGRILAFVTDAVATFGYPTTVREIQSGCGISSTSVVAYNLRQLRKSGLLAFEDEIARTVRPA